MTRTILITGAASGIGAAAATHLRDAGHRVIRVDLRDADIVVDLGTPAGRAELVARASQLAPEGLDGVLAGAGVVDHAAPGKMVAVNHFGAIATLEGLRPLLTRSASPRAVAIVSTAALGELEPSVVEACLTGDEDHAKRVAAGYEALVYGSSKAALGHWIRREAVTPRWAGAGIPLNGVGPGLVRTPMTIRLIESEEGRAKLARVTPRAVDECGAPEELAEVLGFLLTMTGRYLLGQIVFVDGGTDAIKRPDIL